MATIQDASICEYHEHCLASKGTHWRNNGKLEIRRSILISLVTMDSKNAKSLSISSAAPLPRTLNVHRFTESRAAELVLLHNIISTRLNGDFRIRRDKRRRTTGHRTTDNHRRRSKRRKVQGDNGIHGEDGEKDQQTKKASRKTRRRMELLDNPISGFGTSGDGTKRLRTHLWHAKRFTMVKRWGFYLPLGLHGRSGC